MRRRERSAAIQRKSGGHLHPRQQQMKGVGPFEGIMFEKVSDTFLDQTRLLILS